MNLSTLVLLGAAISQSHTITEKELDMKSYRVIERGICMLLEGEVIHPTHYPRYENIAQNIIRQIELNGSVLKDNKLTPYIHDGKLEVLCSVYSYLKEEFEPHL